MSSKILRTVIIPMAIMGMILMVGCSDSKVSGKDSQTITDKIVDDFIDSTYEDLQTDAAASQYAAADNEEPYGPPKPEAVLPPGETVIDFIVKDNLILALVGDGLLVHDLSDGSNVLIATATPPGAIVDLGEKVLIGSDNLYTFNGETLTLNDYDLDLAGQITALHHRGPRLYIGTQSALYEVKADNIRELAGDIQVSALATDDYGLWVGTAGDGLYFWNGDDFQKRFLRRDTTIFDNVTALASHYGHVYVGTTRGFFDYDGGRWNQFTSVDGLPSDVITAINAGEWVVKIGTVNGAVTFFNNEINNLDRFDGIAVTALNKVDRKLIAATVGYGLVMESGGLLTTLFNEEEYETEVALEEVP